MGCIQRGERSAFFFLSRYEAGGWAPALSICWDPTFASSILFTNAHRCFNIISCGTRCYLSFLAPLRRHLPMFSRHDINSPKEANSLTDSPSWNLTDNDFVFAEAGGPWGVGGEKYVMGLCFKISPLSLKDQLGDTRETVFYRC